MSTVNGHRSGFKVSLVVLVPVTSKNIYPNLNIILNVVQMFRLPLVKPLNEPSSVSVSGVNKSPFSGFNCDRNIFMFPSSRFDSGSFTHLIAYSIVSCWSLVKLERASGRGKVH